MSGPVIHAFSSTLPGEKTIDQSAGKAIAPANSIHDFEFGSVDRFFVDRASGGALGMPEGVAHFLEKRPPNFTGR